MSDGSRPPPREATERPGAIYDGDYIAIMVYFGLLVLGIIVTLLLV